MANYITTYGGDGYFELGSITINENTIFKFKATPRIAPEGFWLGNWNYWYGIYHPIQSNIQYQLKWYSFGGKEGVFYEGQSLSDILDHSFEIETSTSYVKVNGTTVSRNAPINQTFSSFHIGNSANAGQYDARKPVEWEYFQIYQNGVLSLDLVPAFKNNQYCFKDKVTGNYIYGTGTIGGEVTSFSIDINNITAEYSGTSTSITVTADEELSWTASTRDSWISLTNPTGNGNGGFTIVIAATTFYNPRTGYVTVVSRGGDTLPITIQQDKKPLIVYDRPIYRSGELVKKMYRSGELIYLKMGKTDYSRMPLTLEFVTSGMFGWKASDERVAGKVISYSLNDGPWTEITSTTEGVQIPVAAGDKISLKGNNNKYATGYETYNSFTISAGTPARFTAYGNIMSLIDGTNYKRLVALVDSSDNTINNRYAFCRLFATSPIYNAENLIFPALSLAQHCYYSMFEDCIFLLTPPELPATTLAHNCYWLMFKGCTTLTRTPYVLPATAATRSCYNRMFQYCFSLTSAITELPATTLYTYCYYRMFEECPITTAPTLPALTLRTNCYEGMFLNCTNLTTAPELPAQSLNANYCYKDMFSGCTNLNYIKCLATSIGSGNTTNWVDGVASSGTFVKDPNMNDWTTGVNGIPNGWTVQ